MNGSDNLNTKFNKITILPEIVLWLYVYTMAATSFTIYSDISLIFMLLMSFVIILKKKNLVFNLYFVIELLFIAYSIYQNIKGITVYTSVAESRIQTLFVCWIANIAAYNLLVYINNVEKIMRIYVNAMLLSTVTLLVFGWQTMLSGRFLQGSTLRILGIVVHTDANSTAIPVAFAAIICFVLYRNSKIKCLIFETIFLSVIILSASRTSLLIVAVGISCFILYQNPSKRLRYMSLIVILASVSYFMVTTVPLLYNSIGYRLESALQAFITGKTDEASLSTRNKLTESGLMYFRMKPINGYGIDNFKYIVSGTWNNPGYYAHNNFVEILFSGGIVGFVIYYLRYFYLFLMSVINLKSIKNIDKDYIIVVGILIVCIISLIIERWSVPYFVRIRMIMHIFLLSGCKILKNRHSTFTQ